MGLFSALQQPVQERPFFPPPSHESKPSAQDLIQSARQRSEGQQRLPIPDTTERIAGRMAKASRKAVEDQG
jgi:hypothetical protein